MIKCSLSISGISLSIKKNVKILSYDSGQLSQFELFPSLKNPFLQLQLFPKTLLPSVSEHTIQL